MGKIKDEENYVTPGNRIETKFKYSGGISTRFIGATGLELRLGKNTIIFTEICFTSQTWAPERREITSFTVRGEEKISTLTTLEKEV